MVEMIERIEKIEKALDDLCSALQRRGTEQDGSWGYPQFHEELTQIRLALSPSAEKEGTP